MRRNVQWNEERKKFVTLSFFNFITITTTEDIKKALELIATTPESANIIYLWERAYEDGYEKGRKSLLQNLEGKMEEKFDISKRGGRLYAIVDIIY